MSLYFGKLWDVVFWVLTFILFCWKGNKLPYADEVFEYEFSFLFLWLLTEPTRLFLGSKGNKTLTTKPLLFSLTLAGFSLFLHVYYIVAQAFVLRADLVMNSISMAFLGAQFLLTVGQVMDYSNYQISAARFLPKTLSQRQRGW